VSLHISVGTVMSRLNRARKAVVVAVRQASEGSHE
jgi:DNA-directed RNA polymerase specialized sigma24 family protein